MDTDRRTFLRDLGKGMALLGLGAELGGAAGLGGEAAGTERGPAGRGEKDAGGTAAGKGESRRHRGLVVLGIGACSWNVGGKGHAEIIARASEYGLDGVEFDVKPGEGGALEDRTVRREMLAEARTQGIAICSICAGVLNNVPLKSEKQAEELLALAIETAVDLKVRTILVPFFGRGKMNTPEEREQVAEVLRRLAPKAERAKVILGLENTLSAEENGRLLERTASRSVRVYYDVGNSAALGYDVPREIRMLGDRICQVHIKEPTPARLGQGKVDLGACAKALEEIHYRGWFVLEMNVPENLPIVREHFMKGQEKG